LWSNSGVAKDVQGMSKFNSQLQITLASISTLYFALFSFGAYWLIHRFEEVFEAFGEELPIQTAILMGSYRYWGLSAVASAFILFKVCQSENNKAMVILAWLAVLSLLLIPFTVWSVYSPIFEWSTQDAT